MPSFLANKKQNFIKSVKKKNEKKRPASASSQKSETHSNSSTATVRPIQHTEPQEKHIPEQPIDLIDEEKAMAKKLDQLNLTLPKSKSDSGFNNYIVHSDSPTNRMPRTESFGDIKTLHSVKSNPGTPVSFNSPGPISHSVSPRCDSLNRGDRSLAMSRNRREATYCKYLLRNAAHRRSSSRLSQKVSNDAAMRAMYRDAETPSELTSVTSLSSFGSSSSFHSIGSLNSHNNRDEAGSLGKDSLGRYMAKENKNKITQLLVLARRRQLAKDDLSNFGMKDIAICGKRIDRAYLLNETLHYSGVIYPIKLISTDDLMFPSKKLAIRIQCSGGQDPQHRTCFENDYKICSSLPPHPNITTAYARFHDKVPENLPDFPVDSVAGFSDSTFVISDFLSEGNLRTFVKENQHLLEHRVEEYEYAVCLLLLQLFRALHHLHDNKVVHRDLKLENIIVGHADHPGGGKRLSLSNFGYALYQPDKGEPFILDSDDAWVGGNIAHLPPEILNPAEDVPELDYTKSDVFGAGCMIYEILNLQNPFEADESLIKRAYTQADLPLIPKRSRYSYALDRLVCLLLRHKPSKRISAKRAGDLVEVMLWGPEELRGTDRAAAEQMAAEWLEQQRAEILSSLALKLAENFTPQGSRVQNNAGFSLEDELKCKFLRETSARALTTNLYLLSQCQRGQQRAAH